LPLGRGARFRPRRRAPTDAADANAIIEKAIKARGGQTGQQVHGDDVEDAGKVPLAAGFFTLRPAAWAFQAPEQYRFEFAGRSSGEDEKSPVRSWSTAKRPGRRSAVKAGTEVTGEKLEQNAKRGLQLVGPRPVPRLVTYAGVHARHRSGQGTWTTNRTVGVNVTRDKKPAMALYFDKQSGLLVKSRGDGEGLFPEVEGGAR